MSATWLVQQQGRENFVTPDELKRLARGGKIDAGDLVYHPVLGRWLYARQVEEIRDELCQALTLGAPTALAAPGAAHNDAAVAGFTLGVLGIIPVLGIACALVGLPLSVRGLRRARESGVADRKLAVAGFVLALASLLINGGLTLIGLLS